MASPFPGRDPYLESPLLWHDVHQALAGQIRQQLVPRLAPRYVARLETRFVASTPDEQIRLVTKKTRPGRNHCSRGRDGRRKATARGRQCQAQFMM